MSVRLLVTRPEPDGARTAESLRARGHVVLQAPMLRTELVAAALADEGFCGVVMTSANAARAIAAHAAHARLAALPTFTVGRRTAEAAHAVGFTDIRAADGDQQDLAALIAGSGVRGPLIYLAGEDRAGDIAGALAPRGISVRTAVVYRAVMPERFPAAVDQALAAHALDGVLHFSRRSAEAYLACARCAGLLAPALAPLHYCLSRQVAEPLATAGAAIAVAPRPEEAALLALVAEG